MNKELLPKGLKEDQIICLMKFGSHLYGTATEDSDTDYKGVYIPSREQVLLGRIPKSYSLPKIKKAEGEKNTKDDVDLEIYSIHYFIELACKGETIAIDMLHANPRTLEISSEAWTYLYGNRRKFYTKDLNAMVSYSRKQAAKYGIKGSRLSDLENVIDYLHESIHSDPLSAIRLLDIWQGLPDGEHIHRLEDSKGIQLYQVCGKKFQDTAKVNYVLPILQKSYDAYGKRAQLAKENKGIDWKAVSHAIRYGYQIHSILVNNDFTYPLPTASFLMSVKQGKEEWFYVQSILETLISFCEKAAEKSVLPSKVDRGFWEIWLQNIVWHAITKEEGERRAA